MQVGSLEGEYKEACQFRDEARAETRTMEMSLQAESKDRQALCCAALHCAVLHCRERSMLEAKRAMKERKDMFKSVDYLLMGSDARHRPAQNHTYKAVPSDTM